MIKKNTNWSILLLATSFNYCLAQEPTILYGGSNRAEAESLVMYDTTGGGWTETGTLPLLLDENDLVSILGLALNPITEGMYILFEEAE